MRWSVRTPVIWPVFGAGLIMSLSVALAMIMSRGVTNQALTYDATSALDWAQFPAWQVCVVSSAVNAWLAVQSSISGSPRIDSVMTQGRRHLVSGVIHGGIPSVISMLIGFAVVLAILAGSASLTVPRNLWQIVFTLLLVFTVPLLGTLIGLRYPNVVTPVAVAAVGLFVVTMGTLSDAGWMFSLGGNTAGVIGNSMLTAPFFNRWMAMLLVVLGVGVLVLGHAPSVRRRALAGALLAGAVAVVFASPTQAWGVRQGSPTNCAGVTPQVCVWSDEPVDPNAVSRSLAPYVQTVQRFGAGTLPPFTTAFNSASDHEAVSIAGIITTAPPRQVPPDLRALAVMQFHACPDSVAGRLVSQRTLGAWVLEDEVTGKTPPGLSASAQAWLKSSEARSWLLSTVQALKTCAAVDLPVEFQGVFP